MHFKSLVYTVQRLTNDENVQSSLRPELLSRVNHIFDAVRSRLPELVQKVIVMVLMSMQNSHGRTNTTSRLLTLIYQMQALQIIGEMLLNAGADVNVLAGTNSTLRLFLKNHPCRQVKMLIDAGAEVNVTGMRVDALHFSVCTALHLWFC